MVKREKTEKEKKLMQILFPSELYNLVKQDASNTGNSISATVRQRLRERYEQIKQTTSR